MSKPYKEISKIDEYHAVMETSNTKLVVIDFYADWCGPCVTIAPIFQKLAEDNEDVEFVKVDVDNAEDVAVACSIEAMPTFQFYKNETKVAELQGANKDKLVELTQKHK
mmetsp:Transcript_31102/g.45950  ORF Transcript_31102/g.45950 Transcript_31102/m.45950 type:complete len:109 (+) Transcript_31102:194-520(+)